MAITKLTKLSVRCTFCVHVYASVCVCNEEIISALNSIILLKFN